MGEFPQHVTLFHSLMADTYQNFFIFILGFNIDSAHNAVIGVGKDEKFRQKRRDAFPFSFEPESGAAPAKSERRAVSIIGHNANVLTTASILATARVNDFIRKRGLHL